MSVYQQQGALYAFATSYYITTIIPSGNPRQEYVRPGYANAAGAAPYRVRQLLIILS